VEPISPNEKTLGGKLKNYTFNFIKYLLIISISAILVMPVLLIVLFRVIVLKNNEINLLPGMIKIFGQNKKSKTDEMFDEVNLLNNVETK
jgi:hypothetical protein